MSAVVWFWKTQMCLFGECQYLLRCIFLWRPYKHHTHAAQWCPFDGLAWVQGRAGRCVCPVMSSEPLISIGSFEIYRPLVATPLSTLTETMADRLWTPTRTQAACRRSGHQRSYSGLNKRLSAVQRPHQIKHISEMPAHLPPHLEPRHLIAHSSRLKTGPPLENKLSRSAVYLELAKYRLRLAPSRHEGFLNSLGSSKACAVWHNGRIVKDLQNRSVGVWEPTAEVFGRWGTRSWVSSSKLWLKSSQIWATLIHASESLEC